MTRIVVINANGAISQETVGAFKYLKIRKATNACQLSFDGQRWEDVQQNYDFTAPDGCTRVYFQSTGGLSATVTYVYSANKIQSQDTAQSMASTFAVANLGIAVNAAVNGNLPACDANGYLQITNAALYLISGTNNGRPRQQIVFSVSSGSLNVLTPDSTLAGAQYVFMTIPAGQVISLDSDTDWMISGAGALAKVSVGQIFLNKGS